MSARVHRATGAGALRQEVPLAVSRPAGPLAGTLLLPGPATGGPWPTVLLLPGSGPVDRDSDARRMPLGITRELAEALADAGVASFRYDKRGTGASPGDWRRPGLRDGADDARAALRLLAGHPGVDADRLVLLGHSEGAVLATMLAAEPDPALAGAVLLSPMARPGEELLLWQAEQLGPTLPLPVRLVLRLLRTDLVRSVRRNHARVTATTTDVSRVGGVRLNARWHREFMAYDPRPDLARTEVPVLAVGAGKDLQSDPADVAEVERLVRGPVRAEVVPDVSHLLRHQPRPASLRHYRREVREPLDARVVALVVDWVRERVGGATTVT